MAKDEVVTIGSLIKKDLKEAYFLPSWPSTLIQEEYKFHNDTKYKVYDCPPPTLTYLLRSYPYRNLPAAGDDIAVLIIGCPPPSYLTKHWKTWLPSFPAAKIKSVDDGLQDDVPIITIAAIQAINGHKQGVHPDIMYKVQLKSSIPEIGVPYPLYMNEEDVHYPCVIKVDQSSSGQGTILVKSEYELTVALKEIREHYGWKERIMFQEVIQDVKEVPSFQFYLHKSGEIYWLGTSFGGFSDCRWTGAVIDWNENIQKYYKDLVWDNFTIPVASYLLKQGYFGLVTFEVLITHNENMYLCDVNPRVGGDTTHLLLAPYMANCGYKYSCMKPDTKLNVSAETVVEKANILNHDDTGRVIVISATDTDGGCLCDFSIYAKSLQEANVLLRKVAGDDK